MECEGPALTINGNCKGNEVGAYKSPRTTVNSRTTCGNWDQKAHLVCGLQTIKDIFGVGLVSIISEHQ